MKTRLSIVFISILSLVLPFIAAVPYASADDIDPNSINWEDADISDWPVTTNLSVSMSGDSITLSYDKADEWEEIDGVVGNAWFFAQIDGQWYGSTWEWMRPGQTTKNVINMIGIPTAMRGALKNFDVVAGETYGFMVSTYARSNVGANGEERSNIVLTTWTANDVGTGDPDDDGDGGGNPAACGDGFCNGTETTSSCPADCTAPPGGSIRFIESISPTSAAGGATVTIKGKFLSNITYIIDPEGDTQRITGSVNTELSQSTFTVPNNLRRGIHVIKSGPSLTDRSNGVSLLITAAGAPVIRAVHPLKAVPGEVITVYGFNLTGTVQLKSAEGLIYNVPGTTSRSTSEFKFEVPSSVPTGLYSVVVISPDGMAESAQKININNGGKPFGTVIRPSIPTEGLPGFGQLIALIFTWSLNILGIVVFIMIFYAGFKWFTAAGNTARVNEARGQITNAILGAIILLAAYIILYTINPDLVGGTPEQPVEYFLPGIGDTTEQTP